MQRLAGFGGGVEVLSPPAVRARLITTARDLLGRYRADAEPRGRASPLLLSHIAARVTAKARGIKESQMTQPRRTVAFEVDGKTIAGLAAGPSPPQANR